ncbi:YtxH domain-containing protein [Dyadobacter sp. CY107]|uniref:YtxH domain-containing protein n=1 Tax=Dyadobacter fanqingshengii TaxID=2906443 RepID=UPI001F18F7CA|nr:YtxH domain-containing protein [Dyadobacter fanqingshengii]MCF2506827.1 YtxH domain-containing protein [Dyadobacter fanqingshengii]
MVIKFFSLEKGVEYCAYKDCAIRVTKGLPNIGTFSLRTMAKIDMGSKYDYNRNYSSNSGFSLGMIVSAEIGALATLLFAPKSGTETHLQLKELVGKPFQIMVLLHAFTDEYTGL